jgi:hypothetical protein
MRSSHAHHEIECEEAGISNCRIRADATTLSRSVSARLVTSSNGARIGGVRARFELMRQTYWVQRSNEGCLRQDKCTKWE